MNQMSFNKFKLAAYLFITVILTLGLSISSQSLLADWQAPTGNPPTNNTAEPLDVSVIGQAKQGGLILNTSGGTNGLIVSSGRVGIGTTTPLVKLEVNGEARIGSSGVVCNGLTQGTLRYNSTEERIEICQDNEWKYYKAYSTGKCSSEATGVWDDTGDPNMIGCYGSKTWNHASELCNIGWHVCSVPEYQAKNNLCSGPAPGHFWLSTSCSTVTHTNDPTTPNRAYYVVGNLNSCGGDIDGYNCSWDPDDHTIGATPDYLIHPISAMCCRDGAVNIADWYQGTNPSDAYRDVGNIGIGTNNPETLLDIRKASAGTFQVSIVGNVIGLHGGGDLQDIKFYRDNFTDPGYVGNPAASAIMTLKGSGNIGVGTVNPTARLHIYGTSNSNDSFLQLNNGGDTTVRLGQDTASTGHNEGKLQLSDNGTLRTVIRAAGDSYIQGGNVGIGNTNPTQKLDVSGNTRIDGNLTVTGTITGSMAGSCVETCSTAYPTAWADQYRKGPNTICSYSGRLFACKTTAAYRMDNYYVSGTNYWDIYCNLAGNCWVRNHPSGSWNNASIVGYCNRCSGIEQAETP